MGPCFCKGRLRMYVCFTFSPHLSSAQSFADAHHGKTTDREKIRSCIHPNHPLKTICMCLSLPCLLSMKRRWTKQVMIPPSAFSGTTDVLSSTISIAFLMSICLISPVLHVLGNHYVISIWKHALLQLQLELCGGGCHSGDVASCPAHLSPVSTKAPHSHSQPAGSDLERAPVCGRGQGRCRQGPPPRLHSTP